MVFALALDAFDTLAQSELVIPVLVPLVVSGTAIALMGGAAVACSPRQVAKQQGHRGSHPKGGHKQKQKGGSFNKSKAGKKKAQRAQQTSQNAAAPELVSSSSLSDGSATSAASSSSSSSGSSRAGVSASWSDASDDDADDDGWQVVGADRSPAQKRARKPQPPSPRSSPPLPGSPLAIGKASPTAAKSSPLASPTSGSPPPLPQMAEAADVLPGWKQQLLVQGVATLAAVNPPSPSTSSPAQYRPAVTRASSPTAWRLGR